MPDNQEPVQAHPPVFGEAEYEMSSSDFITALNAQEAALLDADDGAREV